MLIPVNAVSENQKVVRFVDGKELPPVLWRANQIYRSNHCFNFLLIKGWLKQYTHTFCIGSFITALSDTLQQPESCRSEESNASSTGNFDGWKKEAGCKEVFAFGRFVVDGNLKTCFLSLNGYKSWLIVHLDDYRPVSYVRVAASPKFPSDRLIVSVGMKILQVTDKSNSKRYLVLSLIYQPFWKGIYLC